MRHIYLFGPIGSGVNELADLLSDHFRENTSHRRSAVIIKSSDAIALSLSGVEQTLAERVRDDMRNGVFIADGAVCQAIHSRLHTVHGAPARVFINFPLTKTQINWAIEQNLLGSPSLCLTVCAQIDTCWRRYLPKIHTAESNSSGIFDYKEFERRHRRFQEGYASLCDHLAQTGAKIHELETDRHDMTVVFPRVLEIVSEFMPELSADPVTLMLKIPTTEAAA